MATSGEIYEQLQTQYNPNNAGKIIEEGIRDANRGTIENLMRDATDQMGNAYGAFNNAFAEMGNSTARTMSPAQRLALAQSSANQGMQGLNLNRGLRDFYRTSINDTIAKAMNAWQMGRDDMLTRYQMMLGREQDAYQKEQDAWQRSMAERQLAAAIRSNTFDPGEYLEDDGDPIADKVINNTGNKVGSSALNSVNNLKKTQSNQNNPSLIDQAKTLWNQKGDIWNYGKMKLGDLFS